MTKIVPTNQLYHNIECALYIYISDQELRNFELKTLTQPMSERNYFKGSSGLSP